MINKTVTVILNIITKMQYYHQDFEVPIVRVAVPPNTMCKIIMDMNNENPA